MIKRFITKHLSKSIGCEVIITVLYTTKRRIDFGSPITVLATEHAVDSHCIP